MNTHVVLGFILVEYDEPVMENTSEQQFQRDWAVSTIAWYAIFIWFASSLFSQMGYIAFHGEPYQAGDLLSALGPAYWALAIIEVLIWGILVFMLVKKYFWKSPESNIVG